MRTIIAGSRLPLSRLPTAASQKHYEALLMVELKLALLDAGLYVTEVICGMARGADMIGYEWAEKHAIPIRRMPADWNRLGRSAGMVRNAEMAACADALVALWDGKSPGTKSMIETAERRNLKRIHVHLLPPGMAEAPEARGRAEIARWLAKK